MRKVLSRAANDEQDERGELRLSGSLSQDKC